MTMESTHTIVIGAGVIGLAIARAIALTGREVMVLEAEAAIGQGISSRSSEVIHAGVYYPPGSLKAECCISGKALLYEYCESRGVPFKRTGKLIVACDSHQDKQLTNLARNARLCGLDNLKFISRSELQDLEPELTAESALFSPDTGIIDSHALMLALQGDIEAAGGTVVTRSKVSSVKRDADSFLVRIAGDEDFLLKSHTLVNATGLQASDVARLIPDIKQECIPNTWLVRGSYFSYNAPSPFSRLVYPLPDEEGLGIHATPDIGGGMRFGVDAEYCDEIDYQFNEQRKPVFLKSISRWYPGIQENALQPGYVGIRPKLAAPGEGFRDFEISRPTDHGIPGLINLFGMESPGLTPSLAIGRYVMNLINHL